MRFDGKTVLTTTTKEVTPELKEKLFRHYFHIPQPQVKKKGRR